MFDGHQQNDGQSRYPPGSALHHPASGMTYSARGFIGIDAERNEISSTIRDILDVPNDDDSDETWQHHGNRDDDDNRSRHALSSHEYSTSTGGYGGSTIEGVSRKADLGTGKGGENDVDNEQNKKGGGVRIPSAHEISYETVEELESTTWLFDCCAKDRDDVGSAGLGKGGNTTILGNDVNKSRPFYMRLLGIHAWDEVTCNVEPFTILVLLTFFLGLSLLVPGLLMRFQSIAPPSPLFEVKLCPLPNPYITPSGNPVTMYGGSGQPCDLASISPKGFISQRIILHDTMLTDQVQYAPFIAFPPGVSGSLTLTLRRIRPRGYVDILFNSSQPIAPASEMASVRAVNDGVYVESAVSENYQMRVYSMRTAGSDPECSNLSQGCVVTVPHELNQIVMRRSKFSIKEKNTQPYLQGQGEGGRDEDGQGGVIGGNSGNSGRREKLELTISGAWARYSGSSSSDDDNDIGPVTMDTGEEVPPLVLVGFMQYSLSQLQSRGVSLMIKGIVVIVISIALFWFSLDESKRKTL